MRKRTSKKKTPRELIKDQLWSHCKRIVRARDKNKCQVCNQYICGSNAHTSHVIPSSYSLRMFYDIVNLKLLCSYHHMRWWHKNPLEAAEWYIKKYPGRYKYLMKRKVEVKAMKAVTMKELQQWLAAFEAVKE